MSESTMNFKCKVSQVYLFFELNHFGNISITTSPQKQQDVIYHTKITDHNLPIPIKKKFGSASSLFTYLQFDIQIFKLKFTRKQKQAKLSFVDDQEKVYELILTTQNKDQEEKEKLQPEKEDIRLLENYQKKLHQKIRMLQEEIQKKEPYLEELTEKINKLQKKHAQVLKQLDKSLSKYMKVAFEKHENFLKNVEYKEEVKIKLQMKKQAVTDQIVQQIAQCDLKLLQILNLPSNQITDTGFRILFQKKKYPYLQKIDLRDNKIQNIHSIHKIPKLQQLGISNNQLSESSCNYLCSEEFPRLSLLSVSFKKGLNDQCWVKLLLVIKKNFPNLKQVVYGQSEDLSNQIKQKLKQYKGYPIP